jgi:carbonic anhydrase
MYSISRLLSLSAITLMLPLASLAEEAAAVPPDEALTRLVEGNRRFVVGTATHPHQSVERRTQLAQGQHPIAIVLTCSDSRVAPELYFDQGLGDLFVIRNAGNVVDDHVLGSIEYAVEHLHVSLIVVVGHEKCGAVAAAVSGGHVPGHIGSIIELIAPAVAISKNQPGDKTDNAVRANARLSSAGVAKAAPILDAATHSGKVKVVAARYDLASGKVEILP